MGIFLTSDLHFGHQRDFLYKPRGFNNIYEHDKQIIQNWNSIVNPEDIVYVLGDIMLNDNDHGISCLKQLNGDIHIIRGNHDSDIRIDLYEICWNVVEVCEGKFLKVGNQSFYLSHYPCLTSNYDADKPLNRKVISLCGHSHTKDRWQDFDKGLIYHVELDAHNNMPISIEYIIQDIRNKIGEK